MFTYDFISSSKTHGRWIAEGFFLGGQRGFVLPPTDFVPESDATAHGCWSQGGRVQLMAPIYLQFDSFLMVHQRSSSGRLDPSRRAATLGCHQHKSAGSQVSFGQSRPEDFPLHTQ